MEVKTTEKEYLEEYPLLTGRGNCSPSIKRLKQKTRNRVRAILAEQKEEDAVKKLNKLRSDLSSRELFWAESVMRASGSGGVGLPEYFPSVPQTRELYHRLSGLSLDKQIDIVNSAVFENEERIISLVKYFSKINSKIVKFDLAGACLGIEEAIDRYGYSHYLLRKAVLLRYFSKYRGVECGIDSILNKLGAGENRIIISSLIHCYQDEQDFISMKRSIMGIADKGLLNKFTRDMTRMGFHPHGKDEDLSNLIQSCMQSSLIDAVFVLLINVRRFPNEKYEAISRVFLEINQFSPSLSEIAGMYSSVADAEDAFYKHSSAWFESGDIREYRCFQDHFYDSEEEKYLFLDDVVEGGAREWLSIDDLSSLARKSVITRHGCSEMQRIERDGTISRSSAFNYLIRKNNGNWRISDGDLMLIMGSTSSLSRTSNVDGMRNLAVHMKSALSKIVIYFLISKRSRNDFDGFTLRRILQERVKDENGGSLVSFVREVSEKSMPVAQYIYEACNEDFIARLPHLVKKSSDIVEIRAQLHRWMGDVTEDKSYYDRARNLIIDQQINLVKGGIDDNRIYVNPSRFLEWIEAEVSKEINSVVTMLEHNDALANEDDPQLIRIFEQSYFEFCSSKYFGIASYLGRRIRHGTFKGHLYSSVVSIEGRYLVLLNDPVVAARWTSWKSQYEKRIDDIIKDKLHVESLNKRGGLIQPNLRMPSKLDIARAGIKDLLKDYQDKGHTYNAPQLIVEYCWRLVEVDLKSINSFLRAQKHLLINMELINDIKQSAPCEMREEVKDFTRELQSSVSDRLTAIISWFKRPQVVSPKASLGLLYKAVVLEVQQTFPAFLPETGFDPDQDIELMGGAYHVIYDALYVVLFNAAKHGKPQGSVERNIYIKECDGATAVSIVVMSEIRDDESEADVERKIAVAPGDDIENAQLYEDRSGIRKLHHLRLTDRNFNIERISCENRCVSISISYSLVH